MIVHALVGLSVAGLVSSTIYLILVLEAAALSPQFPQGGWRRRCFAARDCAETATRAGAAVRAQPRKFFPAGLSRLRNYLLRTSHGWRRSACLSRCLGSSFGEHDRGHEIRIGTNDG